MDMISNIANKGKLTLGLVFPLEAYHGPVATMKNQEKLAKQAEELGFKALWFRDVPFNDPSFGDAGQLYDPWVYLAHIMNHTRNIALGTGSIILPFRHPVHTAKSINSLQLLSKGRLIVGVASGDRAIEYPAFGKDVEHKSELFRDSFFYIQALQADFPYHSSTFYGSTNGGIDLLPKYKENTPILVTGHSGQSVDWIAKHSNGWLYYPRDFKTLRLIIQKWTEALDKYEKDWKPFMQSLYIDICHDPGTRPSPIHLGFRSGTEYLVAHLKSLESHGVSHVILNLKYGKRPADEIISEIGEMVLTHFQT